MNNNESFVIPLFSSPVVIYQVEEEINFINHIDSISFKPIKEHSTDILKPTYISSDLKILDKYEDTKKIVDNYFNKFKNDVMEYNNTEFKMTTSWVTKTVKNSMSHYHAHKNSVFSGVLYLSGGEDLAPIEFKNYNTQDILLDVEKYNIYNSDVWQLYPQKNMIIFFRSNLMHKIGHQKTDADRYSIAFNYFPEGNIGCDDSSLEINLK